MYGSALVVVLMVYLWRLCLNAWSYISKLHSDWLLHWGKNGFYKQWSYCHYFVKKGITQTLLQNLWYDSYCTCLLSVKIAGVSIYFCVFHSPELWKYCCLTLQMLNQKKFSSCVWVNRVVFSSVCLQLHCTLVATTLKTSKKVQLSITV